MGDPLNVARASALVELLLRYFVARQDTIAILASWNKHCPATTDDLRGVLLSHVMGSEAPEAVVTLKTGKSSAVVLSRYRVATFSQTEADKARWVCLDFDGGAAHSAPLLDPLGEALKALDKAEGLGLPAYLERSGGGSGWHLWLFPAEPISVEMARTLGLGLAPTGAKLAGDLGFASPILGQGIEVFPKGFLPARLGSPIWLPWWSGAAEGGNRFYQREGAEVVEYLPEFREASLSAIERAVSTLPPASYWKGRPDSPQESPGASGRRGKGKERSSVAIEGEGASAELPGPTIEAAELEASPFKEWRAKILEAIDLEAFFSPYLIGRRSGAWLTARDFRSPSGDVDPSAGVADGSDPRYARGSWHSFRDGITLSPFDYLVELTNYGLAEAGAKNFAEAARFLAKATGIPLPRRDGPQAEDRRPLINITGLQMDGMIRAAWGALHRYNSPPTVFRRGGRIVMVGGEDEGNLKISELKEAGIRGLMGRSAQWFKTIGSGEGEKLTAIIPPKEIAQDFLAFIDAKLPPISGVVSAPIFASDGSLCRSPGYNPAGRVWLSQKGADLDIAEEKDPSSERARAAALFLQRDFLGDFSFATQADRAHALGALILPSVRSLIGGPTPLHDVNSPIQGSGKGLFVQAITIVHLGRVVVPQRLPTEEEEIAKTLLSELSEGRPIILLDNADTKGRRVIDSGSLEGVLTATEWTGRNLGKIGMTPVYPNRAAWFITGVNLEFAKGLMRRRVRIRLDPRCESPWTRGEDSFRHPDILGWARENRAAILSAVFSMVLHWLRLSPEARPRVRRLGSFEDWSSVIGGILAAAGVPGFLGHLDDPEEMVVESGGDDWPEFVRLWWEEMGSEALGPARLTDLAKRHGLLDAIRGEKGGKSQETRMGNALKKLRGRVFGPRRIVVAPDLHTKQPRYKLLPVEDSDSTEETSQDQSLINRSSFTGSAAPGESKDRGALGEEGGEEKAKVGEPLPF